MSESMPQRLVFENQLQGETDPAKRVAFLQDLIGTPAPETETIGVVVALLDDDAPDVKKAAARVLLSWERHGVRAVVEALRGAMEDRVEFKRNLIRMLGLYGPAAENALTLLGTYANDPPLRLDAREAIAAIRDEWGTLLRSGLESGIEVLVLIAAVAMPVVGMVMTRKPEGEPFPWIPTLAGIGGGVAAILLARLAFGNIDPRQASHGSQRFSRLVRTVMLGIAGLVLGCIIGGIAATGKAAAEKVIPKQSNSN